MATEKPGTYHKTYSSAVSAVRGYLEAQGYVLDEDDWFREVSIGGKPKAGETKVSHVGLSREGKTLRKLLHVQVYRIEMPADADDVFELNWYVS